MGFLTDLAGRVRRELDERPLPVPRLMARARALPPARDLAAVLRQVRPRPGVIAELKRSSPSAGVLGDADAGDRAAAYETAGAVAVSVLTEPRHFGGSPADLLAARLRSAVPVLRKDFLVDPSQVVESRAMGADAVLLIASILPGTELVAMLQAVKDLGLGALVEAHDETGLDHALSSGAEVVGVNARDLETLEVDLDRALALAERVPVDRLLVVESGVATRRDVERAGAAGAAAVLVGETLMRSNDPAATLRELLGAADG